MRPRQSETVKNLLVCCLFLLGRCGVLWAQNENETVGFRPNHAFEGGMFGENLDILNGGLNLSIPIGQTYQLNPRLGYGMQLSYNSKIWDTADFNNPQIGNTHQQVFVRNEGPFGVGFTHHLGRIYKSPEMVEDCVNGTPNDYCHTVSWFWVSPDGSHHEFFHDSAATYGSPGVQPGPIFTGQFTNDLSYTQIVGPRHDQCPPWVTDVVPPDINQKCFTVRTPDGLRYTLEERSPCTNPGSPGAPDYGANRGMNISFCGWYTTLIEDRSVGAPGIDGVYPMHLRITYDDRTDFKHAIASVADSDGRSTQFHTCEWGGKHCSVTANLACNVDEHCPTGEACVDGALSSEVVPPCATDHRAPITTGASDPSAVATYAVEFPGIGNDPLNPSPQVETFQFHYEYRPAIKGDLRWQSCPFPQYPFCAGNRLMSDPVLRLERIDYPGVESPNGGLDYYSLYFGYDDLYFNGDATSPSCDAQGNGGDYAELACRTLPLLRANSNEGSPRIVGNACSDDTAGPRIRYTYGYYAYSAAFLSGGIPSGKHCPGPSPTCGGSGEGAPVGQTRQVTYKRILSAGPEPTGTWAYCRDDTFGTNPPIVTVTDPVGNATVYSYRTSYPSNDASHPGTNPEDGYAPEWDDGLNYQIDYYEGAPISGRLVRTVTQEYDADTGDFLVRTKDNTRGKSERVTHHDDSGREETTNREQWDYWGHWLVEYRAGFDVSAARITRKSYVPLSDMQTRVGNIEPLYLPGLVAQEETSDGVRVLARTEYTYDLSRGWLASSIARAVPPALDTPVNPAQYPGDVKTTYEYSAASGNVVGKVVTGGPTDPGYGVVYTYGPSLGRCRDAAVSLGEPVGYCGGYLATKAFLNNGVASWQAIDRTRDANTGVILESRDPSDVVTTYEYDALGRLTSVSPASEDATAIAYPSLNETLVTQGNPNGSDFVFTRYRYDGLGRLTATEKRPSAPTTEHPIACQTTRYHVLGHVEYQSEWRYAADVCAAGEAGEVGTSYSLQASDATGSPSDPLGRFRRVIPADADRATGEKVISTDYYGVDRTVTTHGIVGATGDSFPATTAYHHDGLGRLIHVDTPSGKGCSVSGQVCVSDDNCPGEETCETRDGGADAHYYYDAVDRLVEVELSAGPGSSQPRRFTYDGVGRLKSAENPENGTVVYEAYDGLGNLTRVRDAEGNLQTFVFDFAGRLKEKRVKPAGGSERLVMTLSYDNAAADRGRSAGKLTTIKSYDDAGVLNLTEDRYYHGTTGRLVKASHLFADSPAVYNTTMEYNIRGELSRITYPVESPAGHTPLSVDYGYSNGYVFRATEVSLGRVLAEVTYGPSGAVETLTTPGGGKTSITNDIRNRPSRIRVGKIEGPDDYDSGVYRYDGAGNLYRRDQASGATPPLAEYGYDAANRLVSSVTRQNDEEYRETFDYDGYGNMAKRTLQMVVANLVETDNFYPDLGAPSNNRIETRSTTTGIGGGTTGSDVVFDYDPNGNLLTGGRSMFIGSQLLTDLKRYEYDSLNRLQRVHQLYPYGPVEQVAEIGRFGYDGEGNRIWKVTGEDGIKTFFLRGPDGQVLSEYRRAVGESATVAPEWAKDYVHLGGRLIGMKENLRPQTPTGLRAMATEGEDGWHITLFWEANPEPDVDGYRVYRQRVGQDSTFSLMGTAGDAQYYDPTPHDTNRTIYYKLKAVDGAGYESEFSPQFKIVAGDATPPTKPALNSVVAADRQVTLGWTASTDSSGISGYELVRRESPTDPSIPLHAGLLTTRTFVDIGVENGRTYYYRVRARDTAGNWGSYSCAPGQSGVCDKTAVPKDFAPPIPPRDLSACDGRGPEGKISLSWAPNPDSDGTVTYKIYRNDVPVFDGASPAPVLVGTTQGTSFDDEPPAAGLYYYALKAIDAASPPNESAWSNVWAAVLRNEACSPDVMVFATGTDGAVTLRWHGWGAGNQYNIYRRTAGSGTCFTRIGEVGQFSAHTFVDTDIVNNVGYEYSMSRAGACGVSRLSTAAIGIPLARAGNLYQCRGKAAYQPNTPEATVVQWGAVSATPYQPIEAHASEGPAAILVGYHLYHQEGSDARTGGDFDDSRTMRRILSGVGNTLDPYLIAQPNDSLSAAENYGLSYPLNDDTDASPALGFQDMFVGDGDMNKNCVMPRAVYKVYAEGTWLTVESDYPAYFDNASEEPELRCGNVLWNPTYLPYCPQVYGGHVVVPPPTSLVAMPDGPGALKLTWVPPSDLTHVAGYYLYGARVDNGYGYLEGELRHMVPIATLTPDANEFRISGLKRPGPGSGGYKFKMVSFDGAGRTSTVLGPAAIVLPNAESSIPGSPRSVKTVVWTINDSRPVVGIRARQGIKLSWTGAPVGGGKTLLGYRVYRSELAGADPCALLGAGQQTIGLPLNIDPCQSADGASADLTTTAANTTFWDRQVEKSRVYYYQVTQVEWDGTQASETPLSATDVVAGRQLDYNPAVLPPVQGLQAWAPEDDPTDMGGIVLRWCALPQTHPADPMAVAEYRIYRRQHGHEGTLAGEFQLLARINPTCVPASNTDAAPRRCIIDATHACLAPNGDALDCTGAEDLISGTATCGGANPPCRILDTQFNSWPQHADTPEAQYQDTYEYRVTAVGADPESESPQGPGDEGWLNYCVWPGLSCTPRRDPDGKPEYFVCGDEQVRNAPVGTEPWAREQDPTIAPYHVIGQAGCPDCGGGTNPYSPPARFAFYHLDHLGTPRVIYDGNAEVLETHDPLPFGEERPVEVAATTNTKLFTGHERDSESGLDYMLARFYSSSLGRFMAVDPGNDTRLENPQSWNKYTYVRNNPIAYVDPYGMNSMPRPYNVPQWKWKDPCAGMPVCSEAGGNTGSGGDGGSSGGSGDPGQTSGGSSTDGGEEGTGGSGEWVIIGTVPGPGGEPVPIFRNSATGEARLGFDGEGPGAAAFREAAVTLVGIWMTAVATVTVVGAAPSVGRVAASAAGNPAVRKNLSDFGLELSWGWRDGRNLDYLGNPMTGSIGGWLGYWGAFSAGAVTRLSPLRSLFPGE